MANFFTALLVIFGILIVLGAISGGEERSSQNQSLVNQILTVKSGISYGCLDKKIIYQAGKYIRQGDSDAGRKLLFSNSVIGTCRIIQEGEQYYVMESRGYIYKVRKKGEAIEYYTPAATFE